MSWGRKGNETFIYVLVFGRRELREKHAPEALKASRDKHEANKSKLKSDLRKTTAFTKKVTSQSVGRSVLFIVVSWSVFW